MRTLPLSRATLALFCSLPLAAFAGDFRMAFLDVGQGDAAVVIAPSGCAAVIDGGKTGSGATIKAYLKSEGITHLDFAIATHYHEDHIGGIDELDTGTDAVTISAAYDRGGSYSTTAYTQYANDFAGKRHTVTLGQVISLCSEVSFKVVSVNGNGVNSTNENALSVGVQISYGAVDILDAGDLVGTSPDDVESVLAPTIGQMEVYKVHHHGSKYSSMNVLLDALMPTVSVISVGIGNTYGHPTPEAISRLQAHNSVIYQTEDPATNTVRGHVVVSSASGTSFIVTQGGSSTTYAVKGGTPPSDTTPPTAPTFVAGLGTSPSEIDLSWTASTDDVGVTSYRIYKSADGANFAQAGTSTTTAFADLGLASGTTYWYQVTALDAAGNESAASNTASATTLVTPVGTLTVTAPNGGESLAGGSSYAIAWTSSYVSNVKLEYSLDNGSTWTVIASSVAASTGSYTWTVPSSASSQAKVRATDAQLGSPSDASDGTFTITVATPGKAILNEILANEPGSDTGGEFIEVVNAGGTAIDISGWALWDATKARHTFATGTVLAPGKAIVVFGSASAIPAGLSNAVASSTGDLNLVNSGDTVSLRKNKTKMDTFTYGSSLASVDGVSMNRSPDSTAGATFVLHTSLSSLPSSPGVRPDGTAY